MTFTNISLATIATALALALSPSVHAAHQNDYNEWNWSANLDSLNMDKKVADREWIDSSATVLGFAGEYFTSANSITYSIGADILFFDDQAPFSQQTNKGEKGSDASGAILFAEIGPQYKLGERGDNYVTVRGGFAAVVDANRSIANCSNCYSEDINIDGGPYGVIGVGHSFQSFSLGLQFRQYFSGDLDNSFGIKISTNF